MVLPIHSQVNRIVPERTPEQEASRQTEKLQQELNLTPEQSQRMYEINLRYERQRQISNTRSEAMERIKNKNADIQHILSDEQNNRLQNKRYERSSFESQSINRGQQLPNNSTGFHSSNEYRANQPVRVLSNDIQNNYRSNKSQNRINAQIPQTVRRSTSVAPQTPDLHNNFPARSAVRSYNLPTRTQNYSVPQNNSSTHSQSTPSSTSRTTTTPVGSNKR